MAGEIRWRKKATEIPSRKKKERPEKEASVESSDTSSSDTCLNTATYKTENVSRICQTSKEINELETNLRKERKWIHATGGAEQIMSTDTRHEAMSWREKTRKTHYGQSCNKADTAKGGWREESATERKERKGGRIKERKKLHTAGRHWRRTRPTRKRK